MSAQLHPEIIAFQDISLSSCEKVRFIILTLFLFLHCSGNKYTLEAIWNTTVDLLTQAIFTALAIVCSHLGTPCEQSLLLSFSLLRRRKVGSARIASTL